MYFMEGDPVLDDVLFFWSLELLHRGRFTSDCWTIVRVLILFCMSCLFLNCYLYNFLILRVRCA